MWIVLGGVLWDHRRAGSGEGRELSGWTGMGWCCWTDSHEPGPQPVPDPRFRLPCPALGLLRWPTILCGHA